MANYSSHEFTNHSQELNTPTLFEQKLDVFKEKNQQFLDLKHLITRSPNIRDHDQQIIKTSHNENLINKSQVNVPFSWEIKPGVSKLKVTAADHQDQERIERWHLIRLMNLPSPPCPSKASSRADDHDHELAQQVPLYLCPFQSPLSAKSSLKRSDEKEDPFLVAYRKCTELYSVNGKLLSSTTDNDYNGKIDDDAKSKKMKMIKNMHMYVLSCKYSCAVTTDNLMRMSDQLRLERRRRG